MSKAKELAEQMFPEPQMENYDDILEYRNDRYWTFIARGAVVKGYNQAKQDIMEKAEKWWYEHLVGFLKEGLTEGVIAEFKQFMEEN